MINKKLNKIIVCISLFFVVFQLISISSTCIFATDNLETVEIENDFVDIKLTPSLSSNIVLLDEVANVSFESNVEVMFDRIIVDGVYATIINSDLLQFQIGAGESNGFGKFDVVVLDDNDNEILSTIYTYKNQNKLYLSEISHEIAWYYMVEEAISLDSSLLNFF